jgi:hypothetical protein
MDIHWVRARKPIVAYPAFTTVSTPGGQATRRLFFITPPIRVRFAPPFSPRASLGKLIFSEYLDAGRDFAETRKRTLQCGILKIHLKPTTASCYRDILPV